MEVRCIVDVRIRLVPLNLVNAIDPRFNFIFKSLDVAGICIVPAKESVPRGGQALSRRRRDQHDAMSVMGIHESIEPFSLLRKKAKQFIVDLALLFPIELYACSLALGGAGCRQVHIPVARRSSRRRRQGTWSRRQGTGRGGRLIKQDVLALLKEMERDAQQEGGSVEEAKPEPAPPAAFVPVTPTPEVAEPVPAAASTEAPPAAPAPEPAPEIAPDPAPEPPAETPQARQ